MNTVRLNAYAKLNLTLDIKGTEDGYHTIDSLVTTIDLFDRIVVKKRKDKLINVTMHGMGSETIEPEHNNACLAGEAFVERFGSLGADITVYKNIPIGAGLGGSSADAAGVLNGMAKLYNITDGTALKALADALGSDTGYLLSGGTARMTGRGEKLSAIATMSEKWFLLVCPKSGVSTKECYARFDELKKTGGTRTGRAVELLNAGNEEWAAKLFGNDLYEAAASLNPEVREAYLAVKGFSPLGASMTGSGSACFAMFETQELCSWAKSRYTGRARVYCVKSTSAKPKRGWKNPFVLGDEEKSF